MLAILIVILNLSAETTIKEGIEDMQFLTSLQEIIKNKHKPLENRSIGLMAISNIFTLQTTEQDVIKDETRVFSLTELKTWHLQLDGYRSEVYESKSEAEQGLYIKNLLE